MTPVGSGHLIFAFNSAADLNFGSVAGGIYLWTVASIIQGRRRRRRMRFRSFPAVLHHFHPSLIIDFKALATGYIGVTLLYMFWILAIFGPIFIGTCNSSTSIGGSPISRTPRVALELIDVHRWLRLYDLTDHIIPPGARHPADVGECDTGCTVAGVVAIPYLLALALPAANGLMLEKHMQQPTLNGLAANISIFVCATGLFVGSLTSRLVTGDYGTLV